MSAPSLKLQLPPRSLFKWPPDPFPIALPPPRDARTFASPFPIDSNTYNAALDWRVPVTIGTLYATTALIMNKVNRDRKHQPWGISKTKAFQNFVLLHNIFLAVFSGLTFIGMIRALAHTWPGRRDLPFMGKLWPGLRTQNGLAGAADALCKLHGPGNFGDSVFYNPGTHAWATTNSLVKLGRDSLPDNANVGRLWHEGLAFWGWWFYLSKFYEVLDTFIILAKGKRSSTLQTYHHTGAMACMWAGIRYMSPPIWMFCFINSGIHALMYSYYTLSALRVKVPQGVKRTLTTMQISQFLVGITFASLHLFVHYSVPVNTPYTVSSVVSAAASAASSAASVVASKVPEAAAAAAPGIGAMFQKILLRAAGEEGMAQKVASSASSVSLESASVPTPQANHSGTFKQETKYRTEYNYVPCIDTEGQAFAIWLNVFYLAPLTLLFVRFFVRSYTRRGAANTKHSGPSHRISKAAEDAAHGTNRELDQIGKAAENGVGDLAQNVINRFGKSTPTGGDKRRLSANIERIANQFEKGEEETSDSGTPERPQSSNSNKSSNNAPKVSQLRKKASQEHNKLRQLFEDGSQAVGRLVDSSPLAGATSKTKESGIERPMLSPCDEDEEAGKARLKNLEKEAEEKVKGAREAAGGQGSRAVENLEKWGENVMDKVKDSLSESRFTEGGDFSLVNLKDLDESKSGKEDDDESAKEEDANEVEDATKTKSLMSSSDEKSHSSKHSLPEPTSPPTSGNDEAPKSPEEESSLGPNASSKPGNDEKIESPENSGLADNAPSTLAHSKPDIPPPSTLTHSEHDDSSPSPSRSSSRKRSPSPSKSKSKIPQASNKHKASPTKKILSRATTTTSMASHTQPVITEVETGKSNN